QAVRTGTTTFFTAKTPLERIKQGFAGKRSANILGLLITSAKAMAAAHYGAQLGAAEERYVENLAEFAHAYMSYHGLLQVDQMLAEQQRDFHDLYLQTFAYR